MLEQHILFMKNVCSKLIHKNQTVNLKNVGAIPAALTNLKNKI
jgi:hypothetical protein